MTQLRSQKTMKNKKKFEPKLASPEQMQKCRYDFHAFT